MEIRTTDEAVEDIQFSGPSKTAYTGKPEYIDDGSIPRKEFDMLRLERIVAKAQLEGRIATGSIAQVNQLSERPSS